MAPTANKPSPLPSNGRLKNARPPVVPVIPLPIAQKQQQQRQQKQQRQQQQQLELQKRQQELKERRAKDENAENGAELPPAIPSTPTTDDASSLSSTATPQAVHESTTSMSSPTSKTPQSSAGAPTAVPFSPEAVSQPSLPADARQTTAAALTGPPPTNGHAVPDFVFPPRSPRGRSAGRHRGPHGAGARHVLNPQHPAFHQAHPSNGSVTFGALHDSNNVSPAPAGHGPLLPPPPPPAMLGGGGPPAPPFGPFSMPSMGPGDWPGPPSVPLVTDGNGGFPPTTVGGFNPSTPGSFHGSHSPDNTVDGPAAAAAVFGHNHQGGPFPPPPPPPLPPPGIPNGPMPPRSNEPMPSMLSPPFFPPPVFPNPGLPERHPGRDNGPSRGIGVAFVHHLQDQLQHSFGNPQTADCHLVLHFSQGPRQAGQNGGGGGGGGAEPHASTTMLGHRSILSLSYTVGEFLRSNVGTMHPGPFNQPVLALHMNIDDPHITSEASMQALHSLYGHPLEDVVPSPAEPRSQTLAKALANLTAGFIFMLDHVEATGAEQAARLLGWDTVEAILAYCLNGASLPEAPDAHLHRVQADAFGLPYAHAHFRYGRGAALAIRRLLRQALDFVVHSVPADVARATIAPAAAGGRSVLCRWPTELELELELELEVELEPALAGAEASVSTASSVRAAARPSAHAAHLRSAGSVSLPSRAAGESAHAKQGSVRSPKIVFGDFAPRGEPATQARAAGVNGVREPHSASAPGGGAADASGDDAVAALTRVLLNLPFGYLKYVLEHPELGAAAGQQRGAVVRAVVHAVVAARERLRQQVLGRVQAGRLLETAAQREAVLSQLRGAAPPQRRDYHPDVAGWDVLGWQEVCQGGEHGDELVRVWTPVEAAP